jgi:undecaprenyl diphosphate synthase
MAPEVHNSQALPRHVAIVMDGNGRWAERRRRRRTAGHQAGVRSTRRVVEACGRRGIEALTLFAFSSENWRRPHGEVQKLMELFGRALEKEARSLHENRVRLRFVGDLSRFSPDLRRDMEEAAELTAANEGLNLNVAVNYGGRWDIVQAARRALTDGMAPESLDEEAFGQLLSLSDVPAPDLFIRTGGERRISNFLLWQLAYTELYFTDVLWPDFDEAALETALSDYAGRQRRFGRTGAQVPGGGDA